MAQQPSQPPVKASPRFTQELEFVLALANPAYLQYLAVTLPHVFNPVSAQTTTSNGQPDPSDNSDSAKFARYLAYLHSYWSTPAYAQYLTHPAAAIRHLELLQHQQFRRDLIRPDLLPRLAQGFKGVAEATQEATGQDARQPDERDDAEDIGVDETQVTGLQLSNGVPVGSDAADQPVTPAIVATSS